MKTFACVNAGIVTNAITADDDVDIAVLQTLLPSEELIIETTEETGIAFIGHNYYSELVKFQPLQPYASWTWDEEAFLWIAPSAKPTDEKLYDWDESSLSWVEIVIT